MIDYSYWLKILPVLLALAIALIELWTGRENKSQLHLWGVTALSVAAFFAACIIMWIDQTEAARLRKQDITQWSRMEGKMGNEEMMQKYFEMARQFQQELIREQTGSVIDRFFASKEEREKRRSELEELNTKSLPGYKIRFQPLYDYVVQKFDYWIEGVRQRGIAVDLKINDTDSVNIGNRNGFTVRTAIFGNGDQLLLQFNPAVVENGRIAQNFHFQMPFYQGGTNSGEVWAMTVEEKEYRVRNQNPNKFSYKPYQGNAENPMEDANLISVLNDSLNEAMSYVVAEATGK